MAVYYISAEVDGEQVVYAMNATASITNQQSGSLSTHKLENGNQASDNYRNDPETITMTGVISDVFVGNKISVDDRKRTKDYIQGLEKIKNNRIPFTVHYASDLTPRYPCFFKNLAFVQDSDHGYVGPDIDGLDVNSYSVAMNIQVARIGQAASIVIGRASEFANKVAEKGNSSQTTSNLDENEEENFQKLAREKSRGEAQIIDGFELIQTGGQ